MRNLTAINEVSHKAGDMAILEMARRLDEIAGGGMAVIRIGGDEFVLVTALHDENEARALAARVAGKNGQPIEYQGREFPISLACGMMRVPERLQFGEFFTDMHRVIESSKG